MAIIAGPVLLSATGGTISTITGYRVHTFSPGVSSFIPNQNGYVEVLVVGGGGTNRSSGGGGGNVIYTKLVPVTSGTSYPITVGSVGAPDDFGGITSCSFNTTIIAYGGAAGVLQAPGPAATGISSLGASGSGGAAPGGIGGTGANVIGLGFPGGTGGPVASPVIMHGGGGGAAAAGTPGPLGSHGGIGVSYSISGVSSYYGGGGGGAGGGFPNGGPATAPLASFGTGGTPGAVIIRYPV